MTTYNHVLVKCKVCGVDYCIGCFGEECPNCDREKLVFYSADLESRLAEAKKFAILLKTDGIYAGGRKWINPYIAEGLEAALREAEG